MKKHLIPLFVFFLFIAFFKSSDNCIAQNGQKQENDLVRYDKVETQSDKQIINLMAEAKKDLLDLYSSVIEKEKTNNLSTQVTINSNKKVKLVLNNSLSDYDFIVKLTEAKIDIEIINVFKKEIHNRNSQHRQE